MRTTYSAFLAFLLAMLFSACGLFDPEEPLPAYLVIPELEFTTDYPTEGTDSHRITEVWVFANARMVGAYELPAEVPILEEGPTDIQIFSGIKNNGIAGIRITYPFYTTHDEVLDLAPLKKDTIIPQFVYRDNATIELVDDFEAANVFALDQNAQGSMERIGDESIVFEGNRSLQVSLSVDEGVGRIITNEQQYELPSNRQSWLEMNYRSDNSFAVGLMVDNLSGRQKETILILNPTINNPNIADWNKIYVDLNSVTTIYQNATYELFFEIVKDQGNSEANVWLDNIKIVYF